MSSFKTGRQSWPAFKGDASGSVNTLSFLSALLIHSDQYLLSVSFVLVIYDCVIIWVLFYLAYQECHELFLNYSLEIKVSSVVDSPLTYQ